MDKEVSKVDGVKSGNIRESSASNNFESSGIKCWPGNYVPSSQEGCHIVHYDAPWIIAESPFDPEEYGLEQDDDVPDMSIDPETRTLSVINTHAEAEKSFFITTSHRVLNASNQPMATGVWRDEGGKEKQVVTLVLVTRPRQVLDVCYLDLSDAQANGEEPLDLYSDIKTLFPHPDPHTWIPSRAYNFPLGGDVPRLCSQGVGGCFTHFYPGTLHALDFECPVGTPVLALAAGVVREVRQAVTAGGIHAQGLFDWNSVSVLQDDGLLAEYVHILAGSALVCPGDHVSTGQQLCASGDAGFCPTPHLHVQVQEGDGDSAPTCQFALLDKEGRAYVPVAGRWYGPQGASPNRSEALLVGMDRKGILCQQGQIDVSK